MPKVLIIDDEVKLRTLLARVISMENFEVLQGGSCKSGLKILQQDNDIDVVLCDVKLPDGNGVDLAKTIKETHPLVEIILLTAYGNIPDGVKAIKNGAFDYITKGDDNNKIIPLLNRAVEKVELAKKVKQLESELHKKYSFEHIIGHSDALKQAIQWARKVAVNDTTILLTGATGTGKEVFAQAIHGGSTRKNKSFVAINCSAFSKDLLEGELFGHKSGAFTGATADQKGLLEEAHLGTLFLDEIGEMPIDLQAKILRVIENNEFIKIGENKPTKIDVRFIAATNKDLSKEIASGNFREDLYYRLSVFQIHLPSLIDRREDIEELTNHYVKEYALKINKRNVSVSKEAMKALKSYTWKGNIRELKNVIERSIILMDNQILELQDLPLDIQHYTLEKQQDIAFSLSAVEKQHIQKILHHTKGNKSEAARLLGIGIATLYRKLEEYKLP